MSSDLGTATQTRRHRALRLLAWAAFGVACAINLYGLYAPSQPGPPMFPGFDKVAHLGSFALVMVTGALAGLPARWLAALLVVHAISSEVVQHLVLPDRSGDPADVVADIGGIALGWCAASLLHRVRRRRRGDRTG